MRNAAILAVLVSVVLAVACPPQVLAQVEATMEDELQRDQDNDTQADPGDTLRYTITITHPGAPEDPAGTNIRVTVPLDSNTTLVPGRLRSTPVGVADRYDTVINVGLTVTVDDPTTDGVLANDINLDGDTLTVVDAGTPQTTALDGTVVFTADGGFTYTPLPEATGVDTFTYTVTDPDGNDPTPTTVTVGLNVNVAPSFEAGPNQIVREDTGRQTVPAWARELSTGPPHEAEQTLRVFLIDTDNDALFTVLPAISITTGNLTYTPAPEANGTATVTVRLRDDGGTAGGGENTSAPQTFTITVTAVNDAPGFSADPVLTVPEDSGAQTVRGWATDITAGPANEAGQTLTFRISTDSTALFAVLPAIDPVTGDLTYTLATDVHGAVAATIRLQDDGGTADGGVDTSAPQQLTLTVTAVNDIPVATADGYTVAEGTSLTVERATGVLTNDSDVDDDELTAVLVTEPTQGTLTLKPDGSFTYTHDGSETSSDQFTYQATDGITESNVVTVLLTITPGNDTPIAVDDLYEVAEGDTLTRNSAMGVLANDRDADGNALTAALVNGPTHGTLALSADGSFTYIHDGSEVRSDTFTYQASDERATSVVAMVILTILPRNDAPVASGDTYSVNTGATLTVDSTIGVLANDDDEENEALSAVLVRGPAYGTLTLDADGGFTYTHEGRSTTSDSFTYRASDGSSASNVATVTLTVLPRGDTPVAANDAYSVAEGDTLTVERADGVLANDSDPQRDPLTAVLVSGPTHGTLTLRLNGAFSYVHDGLETQRDSFTYQANDGRANSPVATVTLTITPVNDAPSAAADAYSVVPGATLMVGQAMGVLGNDTDVDSAVLTAVLVSTTTHGDLTLNTDGSFTYIHRDRSTPSDTFTYQASDGSARSAVTMVTITVTANTAPVAVTDTYDVVEGETLTVTGTTGVLANDRDAEDDALTAVLISGPMHGTLTLHANGSFTYIHAGTEELSDSFSYQARDGSATSNLAMVTLNVTPVNDSPVAMVDAYNLAEGATLTVAGDMGVLANDTDADDATLTAVLVRGPTQGTLTLDADGGFTYVHAGGEERSDSFIYQASDGNATSPPTAVTFTLTPRNDAPVAANDTYNVTVGTTLTVPSGTGVLANDTDADDATLTAVLVRGPTQGTLRLDADGGFTYVHDGPPLVSDSFTYRASDGRIDSALATVTLMVLPEGDAPTAANDAYSVAEGDTLTVRPAAGVLANDSDPQNDSLTAMLVSSPMHGTLTLRSDGAFTYTHDSSETVSDQFTYQASDGTATSLVAAVLLTIIPVNDAPNARNDEYSVAVGETITVGRGTGVLANDTDAERNPLTAVLLSNPTQGTLTLNADGSFTYSHDGNNTTSDSFTYQASDGVIASNVATVTLTVGGANTAPIATDDSYGVAEGAILTVDSTTGILANDNDAEDDPLTAMVVSDPAHGLLTVNTNGSFTYTHDGSETLSDSFTYQANDSVANSNVAMVLLTITPSNDAPMALADAYSLGEGSTLTVVSAMGVLANDSDDERDSLAALLINGPTQGMLTLNPDGSFTYTHDGSETRSDMFTYQASDGTVTSLVTAVTLTITPVNDAPVASADGYSVDVGARLIVDNTTGVLANDSDVDDEALTAVLVTEPMHGMLTLNADGSFIYTHHGSTTASDSFTYQASDGRSDSNIATVTITVLQVNGPPVAANDAYSVAEGDTLTVTSPDGVLANDTDPQNDPLRAMLVRGPMHGTLTLATDGALTYAHDGGETTQDSFTYQASDGMANSPVATVLLTITPVNDAPSAMADIYSVASGETLMVTSVTGVLANDTDAEREDLTAVLVRGPTQGTLTLDADGSFTYTHEGGSDPSDTFTYRASDGIASSAVTTVTITVTANTAPVAVADTYDVAEGETLTVASAIGVLANDTDAEREDLTAVLVSGPTQGTLTLHANGHFTYVHAGGEERSDSFSYQASDGSALSNLATVTLTITPVNDIPIAMADAYMVAAGAILTVGSTMGVLANDTDDDGDVLTAVLDSGPTQGTLRLNADGSFIYTHEGSPLASDSFTYHANDGSTDSALATVTLTILPGDDAPIAVDDAYSVAEGETLTVGRAAGVLANDRDPQSDPLTAMLVSSPMHGTLTLRPNGAFIYEHDGSETANDQFTYQASDDTTTSLMATVLLTIAPVNDAPSAMADAYGVAPGATLMVDQGQGVLGNDTDDDGDVLTAVLVSDPTHGDLTLNANGSFTYTHEDRSALSDTFTYRASDGVASSAETTVTITVTATNTDPIAVADTYSLPEGDTLVVSAMGVLANDSDADGDPLRAVLVSGPAQGMLTLSADGGFTYTHDGSETTTDQFTYQVSDGIALSNVALVTLTITPSNDAPVAVADTYSLPEGDTLTVNALGVLANDSDVDNGALTAVLDSGPTQGTLLLNADGSFTYTHDGSETASDSFTYQASDGTATSAITTVTLTITAVNDMPALDLDGPADDPGGDIDITVTFTEDDGPTPIVDPFDLTVTDVDSSILPGATITLTNLLDDGQEILAVDLLTVDPNTPIIASYDTTIPGIGTLTLSGDAPLADYQAVLRTVAYTNTSPDPTSADRRVEFVVNDGADDSPVATATVAVMAVNDAPVVNAVTFSLEENSPNGTSVGTVTFTDPDTGQAHTLAITAGNTNNAFAIDPSTGEIAVNNSGALDFETTPSFTLTVEVTDDGTPAQSGTATITVNLTNRNDAPVLTAGAALVYTENQAATVLDTTITVTDSDTPTLEQVTVQIIVNYQPGADVLSLPLQPNITGSFAAATGTLTLIGPASLADFEMALRAVRYRNTSETPDPASRTITWIADDGAATSAPVTSTITVTAVNDAPSFMVESNQTVLEDAGAQTINPWATVIDDGEDGSQTLTFTITNNTNPNLFSAAPAVSSTGVLTYTPAANANGTATLTLVLQDNGGTDNGGVDTSLPQMFTITITAVNDAPTFTVGSAQTVLEDAGVQTVANWAIDVSAGPSNEAGQTPMFVVIDNTNPGLFAVDPAVAADGTLTYTPAANANGTATLTLVLQDNGGTDNGGVDTSPAQMFTITATAVNDAPTAGNDTPATTNPTTDEATAFTIAVLGNDSDTDGPLPLVVSSVNTTGTLGQVTNNDSDVAYDPNGQFESLNVGATATDTFTYEVCDSFAPPACDSATVTVTITGVNDAPVLNAIGAPSLPAIDQDANDNPGVLVSALLATSAGGNPITDPDTGALEGIAVTAVDNTNGDWQYAPAGGTAWVAFSDNPPSDTSATLLAATASIRFVPDGTFNGLIPSGLTFRAWDQTSGANGDTGVNVSVNGDTTAFSTDMATASITVDPVPQDVTYDAVGNTELVVEGGANGTGAVGNAFTTAPDGVLATTPTLTVRAGVSNTAALGSVTIDEQGRFHYTPPADLTGVAADSFTYTVGSGRTATVTINLAGRVWYVQNDASGADTGTSTDPFQTLQSAEAASAAGDTIFVFLGDGTTTNQNDGISLKANQRLLGHQDTTFTVGTATVETPNPPNPGVHPALDNTAGPGVDVDSATGVEIAGLNITGLDHGIAVSAAGALTLEIRANTLTGGTGDGVNVVTSGVGAAVALSLHDNVLAATVAGGAGARLDGSAGGTLTITNFANNRVDGMPPAGAGTGIIVTSAIFDATLGPPGTLDPVDAGTLFIGTDDTDRVGAMGMMLSGVSGDLIFGTLNIFSSSTGLQATGTGAFTGAAGFRLTTASGTTIDAEGGPALDLSDLSLTDLQGSVTSTNSLGTGISLNNVDGTVTFTSSTITNPAGTAFNLTGSTVDSTYGGSITKSGGAGSLVNITGHAAGRTVTFQNGSTLTATNSAGIMLNNVDGTVRFNGTTTLTGSNAGVAIQNGSAGTVTFANASITNSSGTGTAFSVDGGAANITYSGGITKDSASAGLLVSVTGGYTGTLTFETGTLQATVGDGILLDNADGMVQFNGPTTLNGATPRVTIQNNSAGTFTFANASITNSSGTGTAFSVAGNSTANVTYNGDITKSGGGLLVSVASHAAGTLRFQSGALETTAGGGGIQLDNADGTVQFAGTTTLNGARVTIIGSDGTITFDNATITNPAGVAFSVNEGSPTVIYTGSITDISDLAVSVANTTGGVVTLQGGIVTSSATGIAISGTAGTVTIVDADLSGSATVSIANNTAAITFNDLLLNHSAGTADAIAISGGGGDVTITANAANGIQSTVNRRLVNIMNRTGGTITFGGGTLQGTGTSTGISISGAAGDNTVQFNRAVDLGTSTTGLTGGIAGMPAALTVDNNGQAGTEVSFADLDVFTSGRIGINASNGGTLNVTTGRINTSSSGATGIRLNGLTVGMTFSSVAVAIIGGSSPGLAFNGVRGSFATGVTTISPSVSVGIDITGGDATYIFGAGSSVTGGSGTAFNLDGGTANVTYNGNITQNNAQRVVNVAGTTGGSVTLQNGTVTGGASSTGVNINNVNGNVSFDTLNLGTSGSRMINQAVTITGGTGTYSLGTVSIFTNNVQGLVATNIDGTLNSTSGTVNVTNARAINIDGPGGLTTLGMTLTTVSSTNSTTNGMLIQDTGGSFTITGTGTAGSGGTIQNTTGADNFSSIPVGTGIVLNNTRNVSLTHMQLNDHSNYAIRGSSVVNFTMDNTIINGTNGTNAATPFNEGSVRFTELTGSAAVTNCNISGAAGNNFAVINTAGTLNRITVIGTTFGPMSATTGESALLIESLDNALINTTVQNSTFTAARGNHIARLVNSSSASDTVITGNTISNTGVTPVSGGGAAIRVVGGSNVGGINASATFNVSNNTMRDSLGTALAVNKLGGSGTFSGTIANNTVGVPGVSNSGAEQGSGIFVLTDGPGSYTASITGNTVHQYGNFGIFMQTGGSGVVGSGDMRITVTGNTVANPGTLVFAKNGVQLNGGVSPDDTYRICLTLGGAGALANAITGTSTDGGTDFWLRQRQSTTVYLPGYGGANNDDVAVVSFAQGNNDPVTIPTGSATNTVPTGGGFQGVCPF